MLLRGKSVAFRGEGKSRLKGRSGNWQPVACPKPPAQLFKHNTV